MSHRGGKASVCISRQPQPRRDLLVIHEGKNSSELKLCKFQGFFLLTDTLLALSESRQKETFGRDIDLWKEFEAYNLGENL